LKFFYWQRGENNMRNLILILLVATLTLAMPLCTRVASAEVRGDINGDGKVTILDVTLAASQYMLEPSDPGYNSTIVGKADLAEPQNGIIDILDLVTIISCYT
jgi:hypothetical protein